MHPRSPMATTKQTASAWEKKAESCFTIQPIRFGYLSTEAVCNVLHIDASGIAHRIYAQHTPALHYSYTHTTPGMIPCLYIFCAMSSQASKDASQYTRPPLARLRLPPPFYRLVIAIRASFFSAHGHVLADYTACAPLWN